MSLVAVDVCRLCYSPLIIYEAAGVEALGINPDGTLLERPLYKDNIRCVICGRLSTSTDAIVRLDKGQETLYVIVNEYQDGFAVVSIPVVPGEDGSVIFSRREPPKLLARLDANELTRAMYKHIHKALIDRFVDDSCQDVFNALLHMANVPTEVNSDGS